MARASRSTSMTSVRTRRRRSGGLSSSRPDPAPLDSRERTRRLRPAGSTVEVATSAPFPAVGLIPVCLERPRELAKVGDRPTGPQPNQAPSVLGPLDAGVESDGRARPDSHGPLDVLQPELAPAEPVYHDQQT